MLVGFSENVLNACPYVFDEPLHVGIVTHALHVDHVGGGKRTPLCLGDTGCPLHVSGSFHQSDWEQSKDRQLGGTSRRQSRRFLQPMDIVQNFSSSIERVIDFGAVVTRLCHAFVFLPPWAVRLGCSTPLLGAGTLPVSCSSGTLPGKGYAPALKGMGTLPGAGGAPALKGMGTLPGAGR